MRDPYAVWISEIMLQQTRVDTVAPRFRRFLERFPTVQALAESPLDDVLAEWSGLGYYARARNLHSAACEVCERYGGRIPDDPDAVRSLRGVGRYTAGAILSIAFGREEPVLDGNVERVLSRVFVVEGDPRKAPAREILWRHAAELVRGEAPGDLNQALMELGATLCSPRSPACLACPVRARCGAFSAGRQEELPEKSPRGAVKEVRLALAVIRPSPGRILLWRRPADVTLFGGLWEPPSIEQQPGEEPTAALRRLGREILGVRIQPEARITQLVHVLSHRRLLITAHSARVLGRPRRRLAQRYDVARSLPFAEARALGLSAVTARILDTLA